MTQNSSATALKETPHSINKTINNLTSSIKNPTSPGGIIKGSSHDQSINHAATLAKGEMPDDTATNRIAKRTITRAIKRRAQALIKSRTLEPESRALIRYALEIEDPWLPELVRRADAGEAIMLDFSQSPAPDADDSSEEELAPDAGDSSEEKLAALAALDSLEFLAEMICRPGDEPLIKSAALLVLMAKLEDAAHPKGLANTLKHLAFTHCGELNLWGMVDTQIAMIEHKLLESEMLENTSLENKSLGDKSLVRTRSESFRRNSRQSRLRRESLTPFRCDALLR